MNVIELDDNIKFETLEDLIDFRSRNINTISVDFLNKLNQTIDCNMETLINFRNNNLNKITDKFLNQINDIIEERYLGIYSKIIRSERITNTKGNQVVCSKKK
jgi:hypothetical protein